MSSKDRLFVPLSTKWFNEYKRGRKKAELRTLGHQYNVNNVVKGRRVELRRGYSTKESLWGTITSVWTIRSIAQLCKEELREIIPDESQSNREWLESYEEKNNYTGFIVFRIKLDG
jgi:hypothetical protein